MEVKVSRIDNIIVSTYFDPPQKFSKNFSCTLAGTNSKSCLYNNRKIAKYCSAVGVFEFVPLFDDKVQEKFLENFSGGSK